jgi:hypothetical protein
MKKSQMSDKVARRKVAAQRRWTSTKERYETLSFAEALYERDRDSHASVLGSAIALRLFLFIIPANVALVGMVNLFRLGSSLSEQMEENIPTGEIAKALGDLSWTSALWVFLTGAYLTLWTGRSLSRVLATAATSAWRLPATAAKIRVLAIVSLTGVFFFTIAAGGVFRRVNKIGSFPASLGAFLGLVAVAAVVWFIVMLTLPRVTQDPGSLLPGAAMVGLFFASLQWFMQSYLPNRVARTSDTLGDLATVVAALGNFFFIGRLMSSSFVLTAVIYERYGSISEVIFGLPLLRRIPQKSPKVRTYFALDDMSNSPH